MKALVIDRQAVKQNLQVVRQRAETAAVYADLSANGQGMGVVEAAQLLRDEGIGCFAVSSAKDALELRNNGFIEESILMVRSTTDTEELGELVDLRVICTIGSPEAAAALNGTAEAHGTVAEAQIKVDSGLGHYGFLGSETDKILSVYKFMPSIAVVGVYTSFSGDRSDEKRMREQFDRFQEVLDKIKAAGFSTGATHAADSAALLLYDFCRLDAVCVGSALIGRPPCKGNFGLKKVGLIEAELEEVGWHPAGSRVGPGKGRLLRKPAKIAVMPVGWYHGVSPMGESAVSGFGSLLTGFVALLKRRLSGRTTGYAKLKGGKAKILGGIGLDFLILDVTAADSSTGDVASLDADPRLVKDLPVVFR